MSQTLTAEHDSDELMLPGLSAQPLEPEGVEAPLDPVMSALVHALKTARQAIEDETYALRTQERVDYTEYHRRKDLCLLDLTRRARNVPDVTKAPEAMDALRALRDAIIENQAVLKTHLAAAREVADIVIRALAEEDSDKTYDAARGQRMRKA